MGGAVARVPGDATAFPHRQAHTLLWIIGAWQSEEDPQPHQQWARAIGDALQPYASGGVYMNALGDEPVERVRSAYGSNWLRLTEIKRGYDPDNLFRHNANIQPATG